MKLSFPSSFIFCKITLCFSRKCWNIRSWRSHGLLSTRHAAFLSVCTHKQKITGRYTFGSIAFSLVSLIPVPLHFLFSTRNEAVWQHIRYTIKLLESNCNLLNSTVCVLITTGPLLQGLKLRKNSVPQILPAEKSNLQTPTSPISLSEETSWKCNAFLTLL